MPRGAGGIDGSVEVAPTALDTNVGRIDTPGLMGWLEMTAQPLFQFGTVALDPAPDCGVVRFQAALAEQFFDIAERERVPKVPAHSAKNQLSPSVRRGPTGQEVIRLTSMSRRRDFPPNAPAFDGWSTMSIGGGYYAQSGQRGGIMVVPGPH